jgi:glycogen debranching enzyme
MGTVPRLHGGASLQQLLRIRHCADQPKPACACSFEFKRANLQEQPYPVSDSRGASSECQSFINVEDPEQPAQMFLAQAGAFSSGLSETLAPTVMATLEQARRDLAGLRLDDLDHGVSAWTMAAGLPVYTALFGRDTLTTSWQAAMLGSEMLHGTLSVLAECAGKQVNDWRDEQPGRMIHQMNTGPLAALNYGPLGRYYGSVTTSGFYPFAASALWHWTGDKDLAARGSKVRNLQTLG